MIIISGINVCKKLQKRKHQNISVGKLAYRAGKTIGVDRPFASLKTFQILSISKSTFSKVCLRNSRRRENSDRAMQISLKNIRYNSLSRPYNSFSCYIVAILIFMLALLDYTFFTLQESCFLNLCSSLCNSTVLHKR